MRIAVYYHCFAVDGWEEVLGEFCEALHLSGLDREMHEGLKIGVVTPDDDVWNLVADFVEDRVPLDMAWRAKEGWEQHTLKQLWMDMVNPDHVLYGIDAVLYCHTKGITDRRPFQDTWRRSMTIGVVERWRACVEKIERGYDTVGCHWLTPQSYRQIVSSPFYGGNFWWAKADYIRKLPEPTTGTRHEAEAWLGRGDPNAFDVRPGFPMWGTFLREAQETADHKCSLPPAVRLGEVVECHTCKQHWKTRSRKGGLHWVMTAEKVNHGKVSKEAVGNRGTKADS